MVYVTGDQDGYYGPEDVQSRKSLEHWCVFDFGSVVMFQTGHQLADALNFEWGLRVLEKHKAADPRQLVECRERIAGEMKTQLQRARDLTDRGDLADARSLLEKIDTIYGSLATSETTDLAEKIGYSVASASDPAAK